MPISLKPGQTFKVILTTDKDTPDPKPAFIFRYLTVSEFMTLGDMHDKLVEQTNMREAIGLMLDTVGFAMVGWENMGDVGEYAKDKLAGLLTLGEAKELSGMVLKKQRLNEDDRGN
jgi:hypothetical protein